MGIWDYVRVTAGKPFNRNVPALPPDTNESQRSHDMGLAKAVTQMGDAVWSNGAEKLKVYVPDPDHREKIGRILSNLSKLAIDSAVNESLKGVTGGIQVYKIVKEGLQYQPPSHNSNDNKKPELTLVMEEMKANVEEMRAKMEEMQAKMEVMQEDMNNKKQQSKISIHSAKGSEPLKELPNEIFYRYMDKCVDL